MSKRTRPGAAGTTHLSDDLQRINGIGPTVAQRLEEAGVASYTDLAALTPARIADLLADVAGTSATRIAKQDWVGQACCLADGNTEPSHSGDHDPEGHQRYVTFHVELLVGPDDTIRRTHVRHYQSDVAESWAGWDPNQLVEFLHQHASINDSAPVESAVVLPPSPIRVESLGPDNRGPRANFALDSEPAAIQLTLVVDSIEGLDTDTVDFTAGVVARTVGSLARHAVGTTAGSTAISTPMAVRLTGPPLSPGLYFLEADVAVYVADHAPDDEPLCRRRVPGALIHVSHASAARAPVLGRA